MATEQTLADLETSLRTLGSDADAGRIDPEIPGNRTQTAAEDRASAEAEKPNDETPPDDAENHDTTKAGNSGTDPEAEKPEAEKETEPPEKESKYTKAKKSGERLDRSWKSLNEEKEQFRKEREEWLKTTAAPGQTASAVAAAQASTANQPANPARDSNGHTAEDYERAAPEIEKAGHPDLAKLALHQAAQMRAAAQQQQQPDAESQHREFIAAWNHTIEEAVKADPELGKPDSAIAREVTNLIADEPVFSMFRDGFKKAVMVAKLRQEAGKVPELQAQVDKYNKEIERLNKLTSLGGSNPTTPAGPRRFDEMSAAEQETEMRRLANQADQNQAA